MSLAAIRSSRPDQIGSPTGRQKTVSDDGSALQEYTRLANDLLFNPEATIDRVEAAYERQLEGDAEDQESLDGSPTRAQLEEVREDLAATADQFEQRKKRLREWFS